MRTGSARRGSSDAGRAARRPGRLAALALVALSGLAAFGAGPVPRTELVSADVAGTGGGDRESYNPAINANGRWVAFESSATNLAAADTEAEFDVFLRDTLRGVTTLVSVAASGSASANGRSDGASVSANGRYVAFRSSATDLTADPVTGSGDVFVRDVRTGTTTLVSVNLAGTGGADGFSSNPEISADGRYVAFVSTSTDLVTTPRGGPSTADVYVRDLKRRTTTLVSVNAAGTAGGNGGTTAVYGKSLSVSANGRYVAFESSSSDLVAGVFSRGTRVFRRDVKAGVTVLVSVRRDGGAANAIEPSISANGRLVAFTSSDDDLSDTPTGGRNHIFVRDVARGTTTLESMNAAGTAAADVACYVPSISSDGRHLTFTAEGTYDLVSPVLQGLSQVFVRDRKARRNTLVSADVAGTGAGDDFSEYSAISGDGRSVVFYGPAANLVAGHAGTVFDVFVRRVR